MNKVEIYGGDNPVNAIPGALTSLAVASIGPTGGASGEQFNTTAFGPVLNNDGILVNDLIDLSNTTMASTPAWTVVLYNFQGTVANWFSITEIKVYGEPAPVPIPAAFWLMFSGLLGGVTSHYRRAKLAQN